MNTYIAMKERHRREVNDFPLFFAFNSEQLRHGLALANKAQRNE